MTIANLALDSLSDDALLSATRELVAKSLVVEADLIEHIGEIDERQLYRDHGYPSMFAFCMDELGFSECATYNRLGVARAARRFPTIIEALRSGKIHLAGLRLLAPHLTQLNCDIVLPQAFGKSKRMIEELVARIAPCPPVRQWIKRVPESPVGVSSPIPQTPLPFTAAEKASLPGLLSRAQPGGGPPSSVASPLEPGAEGFADGAGTSTANAAAEVSAQPATASIESGAGCCAPRMRVLVPLSGETFLVRFTASRELRDKLVEAQALLSYRVPDGDLAKIMDKALDALIAKVKKERFGIGCKPRRSRNEAHAARSAEPAQSPETARSDQPVPETSGAAANEPVPSEGIEATCAPEGAELSPDAPYPEMARSRHIPAAIRRAVYERDGGRCTFVEPGGHRCEETRWLEFDHETGFTATREHTVVNIRLRCRAHNQLAAEKLYGRNLMVRARADAGCGGENHDPTRPGASSG